MSRFDNNLVVLGAGSGGLISALIAATVRAEVTLIERNKMGGDCLNTGCVPSKALIKSAKVAHTLRTAHKFGMSNVEPEVDFAKVMQRVQVAIDTIAPKDSVERYTELGVNCIMGEATLEDAHSVRVNDTLLSTKSIVLATGASPFVPPIPGLREIPHLTSDNLWSLTELPKRLLVMGGGPIGCELAQAFQRLGSQVTLIDMAPRLLPREDTDVSDYVLERFKAEGMDVRLECKAVGFEAGLAKVELPDIAGAQDLPFDQVLVAVGRSAHSKGMGLESLGVDCNPNGTLVVDDYLRTSVGNIYGCGDVVGPYQFTHMAAHQAWFASVNALFGQFWKFKVNYSVVPWTTYIDPEVARVGLSEQDAAEQGIPVDVTRYGLDDLDRAIVDGTASGWVKVLTKPGSDKILGACIVGPSAGELIGEMVSAMTHGLGLKKIMGTVHIYPTYFEANKFAASAWRKERAPDKLLDMVGKLHQWLR